MFPEVISIILWKSNDFIATLPSISETFLNGLIISPHLAVDRCDRTRTGTKGDTTKSKERCLSSYGSVITVESRQWNDGAQHVRLASFDSNVEIQEPFAIPLHLFLRPFSFLRLLVLPVLSFPSLPLFTLLSSTWNRFNPELFAAMLSLSLSFSRSLCPPSSLMWFYRFEKSTADSALNYRVAPCTRPW